jgi:hypothetical protein
MEGAGEVGGVGEPGGVGGVGQVRVLGQRLDGVDQAELELVAAQGQAEVAADGSILRLTPDERMAPLFGDSEVGGRRDILEGRMIWVAYRVLRSGSSVVLDFGCWSPEERYAIGPSLRTSTLASCCTTSNSTNANAGPARHFDGGRRPRRRSP